jgi:signal transduction histidine kinase
VACHAEGDARALRSLVRNLLDNAARYGTPPVVVRLGLESARVQLCVEDAGTPIAEADRTRIFEPFVRPHGHAEGQGGAGLGLALVRDIARHHDGEVHYEVSEAGGSRFCVELSCSHTRARADDRTAP